MKLQTVKKMCGGTLALALTVGLALAHVGATTSATAQVKRSKKTATTTTTTKTSVVTVRGRVDRKVDSNSYPAALVKVAIVPYLSKDNKKAAILAYTGSDGMYYFHVRPDKYLLQVWVSERESKRFTVTVANQKYVDVAPIPIP